jgi:undecaprenyl diphosphate synthase
MMQHLACIMDGNRRWARKHGIGSVGKEGIDTAYRVVEWCLKKKIPYLSLFAFSLENFKRSPLEIEPVFTLMVSEMARRTDELVRNQIQIRFVGDREQFPHRVRAACVELEEATRFGAHVVVQILFCYGARQEIVAACTKIAEMVANGILHPAAITADLFAQNLWTAADVPCPDLILRTGYVDRLSNFLLYQAAYAELYFPEILWPELTHETLDEALTYYNSCKRNFGV